MLDFVRCLDYLFCIIARDLGYLWPVSLNWSNAPITSKLVQSWDGLDTCIRPN